MNPCHRIDLTDDLLRLAALTSFAPDDDDADADDTSPAGDDEGHVSDGAAGEDDGDTEVDNPRVKQLSDEAAKYRRLRNQERDRADKAEARVAELEKAATGDLATENRTLHLRLAFERATNAAKVHDVEAAWLLVQDDLNGVTVNKGQVDTDRIGQIVDHVVDRYPYLVGADEDELATDAFPPSSPSGRTPPARQTGNVGMDNATLAKKFPALRR